MRQDLVEVLSRPDTWKTALKHDQAAYQRNADGSYRVSCHAAMLLLSCWNPMKQHLRMCR